LPEAAQTRPYLSNVFVETANDGTGHVRCHITE
jgi:hypothetical protein